VKPGEAQQLMLRHCISFVELSRASALTVDALKKRIVASRHDIPSSLAALLQRMAYERTKRDPG